MTHLVTAKKNIHIYYEQIFYLKRQNKHFMKYIYLKYAHNMPDRPVSFERYVDLSLKENAGGI